MTRKDQKRFRDDKRGATAIEYALIAAGIAAVLVGVLAGTGTSLLTLWTSVATALR